MILDLVKPILAVEIDDGGKIIPEYAGTGFNFAGTTETIGDVLSKLLPYVYVFAGLALLLILISGGIGLMTSAGNPDKIKSGYGKITSALIGFFIVFISYIVVMLVETIFGVDILGSGSGSW